MENCIRLDAFHQNKKHSDVEFLLKNRDGHEVRIPAHRLLLGNRSDVFDRMFNGEWEGSSIPITNVHSEEFSEFLQFFYFTKIQLSSENIAGVLKLIDKYNTPDFYPICEQFIEQTLTEQLALQYYELALSFNLADGLKGKLENMVARRWKFILREIVCSQASTKFLFNHIFRSDLLRESEYDIFIYSMDWIKAVMPPSDEPMSEERIKDMFGDVIENIRFPRMTVSELIKCFGKYPGLLSSAEQVDLLSHAESQSALTTARRFNCNQRHVSKFLNTFNESPSYYTIRGNTTITFKLQWDKTWYPTKWSVSLNLRQLSDDNNSLISCLWYTSKKRYSDSNIRTTSSFAPIDIGEKGDCVVVSVYFRPGDDQIGKNYTLFEKPTKINGPRGFELNLAHGHNFLVQNFQLEEIFD